MGGSLENNVLTHWVIKITSNYQEAYFQILFGDTATHGHRCSPDSTYASRQAPNDVRATSESARIKSNGCSNSEASGTTTGRIWISAGENAVLCSMRGSDLMIPLRHQMCGLKCLQGPALPDTQPGRDSPGPRRVTSLPRLPEGRLLSACVHLPKNKGPKL